MTDCPILKENEKLKAENESLKEKLKEATDMVRNCVATVKEKK